MIVTKRKDPAKVLSRLEPYKRIVILGCGDCATICRTGGEEEVRELSAWLSGNGKQVIFEKVVQTACDMRLVRLALRDLPEHDAILAASCGLGLQAVADLSDKPCFTCNDTRHAAVTRRIGEFAERCALCKDCIADQFGGICPITCCNKSLVNGPCGGSHGGKCESGDKDCGWALIFERMRKQGRLDELSKAWVAREHR